MARPHQGEVALNNVAQYAAAHRADGQGPLALFFALLKMLVHALDLALMLWLLFASFVRTARIVYMPAGLSRVMGCALRLWDFPL